MALEANMEIRNLSDAEMEAVSGGVAPLVGAALFFGSWAATKALDALGSDEPMTGPMKVVLDHYNKGGKS
jgi:lactobin A/cerein 7B family class IIb bacteriocin